MSCGNYRGRAYTPFARPNYQPKRIRQEAPLAKLWDVADVKEWLGLDAGDTGEDDLLNGLIDSATNAAEEYTRRAFITRTITGWWDCWPGGQQVPIFEGYQQGPITGNSAAYVELLKPPLQSVTSIAWYLEDGQTVDPWATSNYFVDMEDRDQYGRVVLNNGAVPPSPLREANGLSIVYKAGYGDAATDVPYAIRQAVMMLIAFMYGNRGDCPGTTGGGTVDPIQQSGAGGMLDQYRIMRV